MNYIFGFLLCGALLLGSCCEDDEAQPIPSHEIDCASIDCEWLSEYAGSAIMNDECWQARWAGLDTFSNSGLYIYLSGNEVNGIWEYLTISVNEMTNLEDTIWIGGFPSNNPVPNLARATYWYSDDLAPAGRFFFDSSDILTYKDYLIIDDFNADTTIVEGRFQVRFPQKNVSNFITHEPDSMNIQCGHFRAKAL